MASGTPTCLMNFYSCGQKRDHDRRDGYISQLFYLGASRPYIIHHHGREAPHSLEEHSATSVSPPRLARENDPWSFRIRTAKPWNWQNIGRRTPSRRSKSRGGSRAAV